MRRMVESSMRVEPHPFLKCGDRVRIKSGPLEGIRGILLRKKSAYRLVLSVEMLEKSVAVEVDVSTVERIERSDGALEDDSRVGSAHHIQLIAPPFAFKS